MGLSYLPHMTIGKLSTMQLLKKAYNDVKTMDNTFHTIVDTISVEMIGNNEESVIVIEKEIN